MLKNRYYCRIDGTIYNLSKIQDVIDKNPENPNYAEIFILSIEEYGLPEDNMLDQIIKFNNNEIPADYNECLARMRESNSKRVNANLILCPNCKSSRTQKISATKKMVGAFGFGLFSKSATSQFECRNCGYKW